jgi:hypothetical protein
MAIHSKRKETENSTVKKRTAGKEEQEDRQRKN